MDNLPNELLLEIFNQLCLDDNLHILPVSIVNRRFHGLANELLYSRYSLAQADPALFISAIASSPSLAKCVQQINWDCRPRNNFALVTSDDFHFLRPFSAVEGRYIKETLGIRGTLHLGDLNRRLDGLGPGSYLDTFLLFTPRLNTLNVAVPSKWDRHKIWFKPALDSHILAHLHSVRVVGPMRIRNLLPLFLVPSLRTLTLHDVVYDRNHVRAGVQYEWNTNNEVFERLQREGSWIENFHLHHCSEPMSEIVWTMRIFHNLKTFEFGQFGGYSEDPSVDLQALIQALEHQRKSLTSLSIAAYHRTLDPGILERLKVLVHVESLSLDLSPESKEAEDDICLGISSGFSGCLPRSLKHLRLIANDFTSEDLFSAPSSEFVDALISLSRIVKEALPHLRTLAVDEWDAILGSFACQTRIKVVQQAFAGNGVDLLARPSMHSIAGDESYLCGLEDVEEGWVWVKWITPPALPRLDWQ